MLNIGNIDLSSSLITWLVDRDVAFADDLAADLFGRGRDACSHGVEIGGLLAAVAEQDRPRVSEAVRSVASRNGPFHEVFEIDVGGRRTVVVMNGRSAGSVLFTCVVAQIDVGQRSGKLEDLCLAAYDAARQENNDVAALHLAGTLSLLAKMPCDRRLQ